MVIPRGLLQAMVTSCWTGNGSWQTLGGMHWQCTSEICKGTSLHPCPCGSPSPTSWSGPCPPVLLEDDGQDVGNWGGLVKVGHTRELAPWERRLVQHLVHKPLQAKQG